MEHTSANTRKTVLITVSLLLVAAVMFGVYRTFAPETSLGEKQFSIEVIHKDRSSRSFQIRTEREFLGDALKDEQLIIGEDGPYGIFITEVDGETADASSQEWWCLTKDGATVNTSTDSTPITDGDRYELTLMVGY